MSHACHAICRLSTLRATLTKWRWSSPKCCACHEKCNLQYLLKTTQKYCACHTKRLPTRYETCYNVTKCHPCHVKRGYATFETSKSNHFCRTRHRHGHSDLIANGCRRLPTVADGCRQLRSQKRRRANTSPPPDPQSKTRTFRYAFGKNWGTQIFQLSFRGVASCGGFGHLMILHGSTGIIQGSLGRPLLSSSFSARIILGRYNWELSVYKLSINQEMNSFLKNVCLGNSAHSSLENREHRITVEA